MKTTNRGRMKNIDEGGKEKKEEGWIPGDELGQSVEGKKMTRINWLGLCLEKYQT